MRFSFVTVSHVTKVVAVNILIITISLSADPVCGTVILRNCVRWIFYWSLSETEKYFRLVTRLTTNLAHLRHCWNLRC